MNGISIGRRRIPGSEARMVDNLSIVPFLLHLGCSVLDGCAKFSLAEKTSRQRPGQTAEQLESQTFSADVPKALSAKTLFGRWFTESEAGANPVVVITLACYGRRTAPWASSRPQPCDMSSSRGAKSLCAWERPPFLECPSRPERMRATVACPPTAAQTERPVKRDAASSLPMSAARGLPESPN